MSMPRRPFAVSAALALALGLTAGCSNSSPPTDDPSVSVVAAFYPLQFAAERVGGDLVTVTGLTKPGAEPHDLELSPQQIAELSRADVVFYEGGFQPAVDEAVAQVDAGRAMDVSASARLITDTTSATDSTPGTDPHFWLDPTRLADVATAMGAQLAKADPANATAYTANAQRLVGELTTLDGELRAGLATCANRDLVTSHAAFGYLADRYDLTQVPISGISPEAEPDARAIQQVAERVRALGVTTVYSETLVSPALAETIARETGAKVAVLDPIEGLTDANTGANYLSIMRTNLQTLQTGQECASA